MALPASNRQSAVLWLAQVAAIAALYYGAGRIGLSLALPPGHATAVWPPSGIALAALLLLGYRVWPGVFLGAFLTNIQDLAADSSYLADAILVAAAIAVGSTLQAFVVAALLRRFTDLPHLFDRARDVFRFAGIAAAGYVLGAVVGVTALCLGGFVPWDAYAENLRTWWLGDLAGVLIVTPLVLVLSRRDAWTREHAVETLVLLAAACMVGVVVHWELAPGLDTGYSVAFLMIPFVVWAGFRLGQRSVVLTTAIISGIAVSAASEGVGPFSEETLNASLLTLQAYFGVLTITGLALAAAVAERKRAEDELKRFASELARSNADLEQFAYVASHDLQEPLRMVTSYCDLLQQRYKGRLDSDADEYIAFAVDGATRMRALVRDLLAYARVSADSDEQAAVDCNYALQRALDNLRGAIADNDARVTSQLLPTVTADATQIEQLFQNLIGNAIKFRREEPPAVQLSAGRRNGAWVFSVADNGIGIHPGDSRRVFEVFQRLNSRTRYDGNGVGLAISKRIVERHGGRIWFDSIPGNGSTFYFTIPANVKSRK